MPSWSSLPREMREEVVKRLDFRTRFRFRHVSKSSQHLVDSVPLHIPRVVLDMKNEKNFRLTFYTAIDKTIDVFITNDGPGPIFVSDVETSFGTIVRTSVARLVDFPSAPMLALTAFRNVAMNRKTTCGGVDLWNTKHAEFKTAREGHAFFRHRLLRTKVASYDVWQCAEIGLYLSRSDIEEVRLVDDREEKLKTGSPKELVFTKRLRVRVDAEDEKASSCAWNQIYLITGESRISKVLDPEELEGFMKDDAVIKHSPNDISVYNHLKGWRSYMRANSCGVVVRKMYRQTRNENYDGCEMRAACSKCADPFEHWYFLQEMSPFPPKFAEFNLNWTCSHKYSRTEAILPIVNGISHLDKLLDAHEAFYYQMHDDELEMCEQMKREIEAARRGEMVMDQYGEDLEEEKKEEEMKIEQEEEKEKEEKMEKEEEMKEEEEKEQEKEKEEEEMKMKQEGEKEKEKGEEEMKEEEMKMEQEEEKEKEEEKEAEKEEEKEEMKIEQEKEKEKEAEKEEEKEEEEEMKMEEKHEEKKADLESKEVEQEVGQEAEMKMTEEIKEDEKEEDDENVLEPQEDEQVIEEDVETMMEEMEIEKKHGKQWNFLVVLGFFSVLSAVLVHWFFEF